MYLSCSSIVETHCYLNNNLLVNQTDSQCDVYKMKLIGTCTCEALNVVYLDNQLLGTLILKFITDFVWNPFSLFLHCNTCTDIKNKKYKLLIILFR